MNPHLRNLLPVTVLLATFTLPAGAASSAASSASDSVAASVGSLAGSVTHSSTSSSKDRQVADGDYRIIEVAVEDGRPGLVRLALLAVERDAATTQAAAADQAPSFMLYLPQQVLVKTGLGQGSTIHAKQRPYGLEFAEGQPRRAFFLALHDDWYRELRAAAVTL